MLLRCFRAPESDYPNAPSLEPDGRRRLKSEAEAQRRRSQELDVQLKEWSKRERNTVKLLLLGTGESGKSTFTKQMKIIHVKDGITNQEKLAVVTLIRANLKEAMQCLCLAMDSLQLSLRDPENQPRLDYILTETIKDGWQLTEEFYDHVTPLWLDQGVQECYRRSNEFQLIDSAKYFIERVGEIRSPDYTPTDQDVLRSREVTTNIQLIKFSVPYRSKQVDFQKNSTQTMIYSKCLPQLEALYDAGGQQGERRKWIQVFQNATAILFIVDSSAYDCRVREDPSKNRLMESVEIFDQVWNNTYLQGVDIYLFLNKIDLLEEKTNQGRLFDSFVEEVDKTHPYHDFIRSWHDWQGPTDKESREFIKAYPTFGGCQGDDINAESFPSSLDTSSGSRRRSSGTTTRGGSRRGSGRKMSMTQLMQEKNIHQSTVKTAVFLKKLFVHILSHPLSAKSSSPVSATRGCQTFYTCAVDTDTVTKVFNACKTSLTKLPG